MCALSLSLFFSLLICQLQSSPDWGKFPVFRTCDGRTTTGLNINHAKGPSFSIYNTLHHTNGDSLSFLFGLLFLFSNSRERGKDFLLVFFLLSFFLVVLLRFRKKKQKHHLLRYVDWSLATPPPTIFEKELASLICLSIFLQCANKQQNKGHVGDER